MISQDCATVSIQTDQRDVVPAAELASQGLYRIVKIWSRVVVLCGFIPAEL